jgi:predicted phage tail protein
MPSKKELLITTIVGALVMIVAFLIPTARANVGLLIFLGAVELLQIIMLLVKKEEKPSDTI